MYDACIWACLDTKTKNWMITMTTLAHRSTSMRDSLQCRSSLKSATTFEVKYWGWWPWVSSTCLNIMDFELKQVNAMTVSWILSRILRWCFTFLSLKFMSLSLIPKIIYFSMTLILWLFQLQFQKMVVFAFYSNYATTHK